MVEPNAKTKKMVEDKKSLKLQEEVTEPKNAEEPGETD